MGHLLSSRQWTRGSLSLEKPYINATRADEDRTLDGEVRVSGGITDFHVHFLDFMQAT